MLIARRKFLAAAGGLGAIAWTQPPQQPPAAPAATPQPVQTPSPPGEATPGRVRKLGLGDGDRDGILYAPVGYTPDKPLPLIVALHGAGGSALSTQYAIQRADALQYIVLAPDSRDERTWDAILGMWGPDLEFIGAAIKYAKSRCAIDDAHVALAGFSDGASYSLSMGIGNGDVFSRVLAMSPGLMQPAVVRGKPKIFISHGTTDPVMPIDTTSRKFVPRLKTLGYDVTYREYEGRHTLPPAVAQEAMEWFAK